MVNGDMSLVSHTDSMGEVSGSLPAFVERAKEDAQFRATLARIGYSRVKATYAQQQRSSRRSDRLEGLGNFAPPIELVRDWLQEERKRIIARVRWTFLGAMLGTIVAGLAFAAATAFFG
jgi:hypothetical protein